MPEDDMLHVTRSEKAKDRAAVRSSKKPRKQTEREFVSANPTYAKSHSKEVKRGTSKRMQQAEFERNSKARTKKKR